MTADTVGGVWSYALELAGALASRGVATALAAMGGPPTRAGRAAALAIPGIELFESSYRLEWMDDPWEDVARAGEWLLDLEARVQPDVIHLNGYCHGALPWRAPAVVVAHSCVLSWWRAVFGGPAPARFDRYRAEVARGLRAAAVVVAPTAAMLGPLAAHYGAPAGRVIPNGRDRRRFRPAPKERFVFAAGRLWDAAKNLGALAAAAPRISWPVLLAGSDAPPGGEPAEGVGARSEVYALGWMEQADLARWMSRAAIYAMPARYEPFGLSILEAGLSGCALVLGDIPSLREVWGDAAVFVPPDDAAALARAVERLIDDAPLRAVLGVRARRRAVRFTPRAMARGYLAAYRAALAPRARIASSFAAASPLPPPSSLAAPSATREEPCA
jgi:glycosyltransferase involved in cell wall biosynthesis